MDQQAQLLAKTPPPRRITLSVAVLHVPGVAAREEWVRALMPRLRGSYGPPFLSLDPDRNGVWWNAKRAWMRGLVTGATHHLVLDDDIIACRDFIPGLLEAISHRPDDPVSPFANRKVCEQARDAGFSWCRIPDGSWGQGFVLPRRLISDFLRFDRERIRPEFYSDDRRKALWLTEEGIDAWCMVPSLIDHVGLRQSLIGHPGLGTAKVFIGAEGSALDIDWSKGADGSCPRGPSNSYTDVKAKFLLPPKGDR